jgi:hypothetical protein
VVFFLTILLVVAISVPLTKGSFHRMSRLQFSHLWLLLVALIAQLLLELLAFPQERIEDVGYALLLTTYVMLFVFCWINRRTSGMTIVAVGIALNFLVIALNQGMPAKDDLRVVDGREVHVAIEQSVKHRPQDDDTMLPFLGDVITFPELPNQQFSIGDIVMGLGILDICFEASRVPRRRGRPLPDREPVSE